MRTKNEKKSNVRFAFYFFGIVLFFLFLSSLVKVGVLLENGKFSNQYQFNLLLEEENSTNSRIISLDPHNLFISDLSFKKSEDLKKIPIPIDAEIVVNKNGIVSSSLKSIPEKLFLNYRNLSTNLTIVDVGRIGLFIKRIPAKDTKSFEISEKSDRLILDKIASSYFIDNKLSNEKITIKIVNGTDVSGLGGQVAKMLTNIGANVVVVSTSSKPEKKSSLSYFLDKTYTVQRLEKIFNLKANLVKEKSDADIIVVLGEDYKNVK